MKVGILGGTFDPIHLGHLIVGEEIRTALQLDKVMFMPAGDPWMKADRQITPASHRAAMVELAIRSNPGFCLSTVEIEHPGWTYTVDTLEELSRNTGGETEFFLLLGWDGLKSMPQWKEPHRIVTMARVVTFPRPDVEKPDLAELEASLPGISRRMIMLDGPYFSISSTAIRERLASGRSIRYLVPDEVRQYITAHRLYGQRSQKAR